MKNRNATYYARVYFPKHLVDRGCPKELRFSLKTKQRSTALDRSFAVLHCARTLISHASEKTISEVLIRKIRKQVAIVIDNHFTLVVSEQPKQKRVKVVSKATPRSKVNPAKQQDLLDQFIEFKKLEGFKNKSLGLLHSRVKAFVNSSKKQLDCVTSRDANDFLASLYTQKLSLTTVRDYLGAVKQFYNWLVVMQFVENNPFKLIKVKTDTRLASEQKVE